VETQTLPQKRREVAEQWYVQSDLNGDQVVDGNGWEDDEDPNCLSKTIFVETDSGEGPSIKKTLLVEFYPDSTTILAAYLPGSSSPDDKPGILVDGSEDWQARD
jgi:hypothetical protein